MGYKYIRNALLAMMCIGFMFPLTPLAEPHEPSPAGGEWLELNPELPMLQSESPWFPDFSGPLTLEAWIYIDEPPKPQIAFSIVGQTNRFNWAILRASGDSNFDRVPDAIGAILTDSTGMVTAHLPSKQWVHYVMTIHDGVTVGSNGFITGKNPSGSLTSADNQLIIGGVPILKDSGFPDGEKTLPASGIYIDELRISDVIRYQGNYTIPTKAFTPDSKTLGLYHFDTKSIKRYEDASKHKIALIRSEKNTESDSNQ